jgi:hypothetical protein
MLNMKIRFLLTFWFITLTSLYVFCQNLVPNPSFELYSNCPTISNYYADLATDWYVFGKTPDYYNSCFPDALPTQGTDVPESFTGYQMAATGNGYVGFMTYTSHVFWREYIGAQLLSPLEVGSTYDISMKVVFSNDTLAYGGVACNKFGLRFSNIVYSSLYPAPTDNFAHLYTNTVLTDTLNWTTISGTFVADSAYTHVMLGNFFDDSSIDTIKIKQNPNWVAYYYVDDVYVGKVVEHTNSIETFSTDAFRVFPNPSEGLLCFETFGRDVVKLAVVDITGIKQDLIEPSGFNCIDIRYIKPGVYFLEIFDGNVSGIYKFQKN